MRALLIISTLSLGIICCTSNKNEEDINTVKTVDKKSVYEQNLAVLKNCISAFENKNLVDYANNIADSVLWYSPAYGDTMTSKSHWMEFIKKYADNWDKLHLSEVTFLPGIDSSTHELDGSVRYYGRWDGVYKTGIVTQTYFYGTYNFNKYHKIILGDEYFDVGGLMNAVHPKSK